MQPSTNTTRSSYLPAAGLLGLALAILSLLLLAAITRTPRVVKIGLVAPFEGRYREIGADVIPAVRFALREWHAQSPRGSVVLELVAYDDLGDPQHAVQAAERIAADPDIAIVIGHWRDETTAAAAPIYAEAGLPLVTHSYEPVQNPTGLWNLAPDENTLETAAETYARAQQIDPIILVHVQETVQQDVRQIVSARTAAPASPIIGAPTWSLMQWYEMGYPATAFVSHITNTVAPDHTNDPYLNAQGVEDFTEGYMEGSLGAPPGPFAWTAYQAAWLAIEHATVRRARQAAVDPVAHLQFDASGRRVAPPLYIMIWNEGQRDLVEVLPPTGE